MILRYGYESEDCDKRAIISRPKNINEAYRAVHAYLNKHGKRWGKDYFYFNTTVFEDHLRIDWGSYSEFFYLEDLYEGWRKDWDEYTRGDYE